MLLYLLRHGHALANERGLVTGTTADPLTACGEQQANEVAARLRKPRFAAHYVSHWRRAAQTAERACPGVQFVIDPRLGETDAGVVATMPRSEFEASHPDFFRSFDPAATFPGGESHNDLYQRVLDWLRETARKHQQNDCVLAVTHMGPIACILHYAFDVPMKLFPRFKPTNASLTVLNVGSTGIAARIELVEYENGSSLHVIL